MTKLKGWSVTIIFMAWRLFFNPKRLTFILWVDGLQSYFLKILRKKYIR